MESTTLAQPVIYDKKNPFNTHITDRFSLTQCDSSKETIHVEVDITGSGFTYLPGDSLGVYVSNDPIDVQEILSALDFTGSESITLPKSEDSTPLVDALSHHFSLSNPTKKFLEALHNHAESQDDKDGLGGLLESEDLKEYLANREFIDLLQEFPSAKFTPQEFVSYLKRLQLRLYSIASSPLLYPNIVHLTVSVVRYTSNGRPRKGVATTFLADRVEPQTDKFPTFMSHSHFKLPQDPTTNYIMVGPGTGVAPFRGFIQHHIGENRSAKNWLFFGDRCQSTDYLYGQDFETYHKDGHLTHLTTAFSRDQDEKVYVQHRMLEHAPELWDWIQNGAYFYVCGDMKHMAKDVDAALHQIAQEQGNMSEDDAKAYVKQMKRDKRYQRDVY